MSQRKIHMVGNWKMNQNLEELQTFFKVLEGESFQFTCEAWIAPQAIHVSKAIEFADKWAMKIGTQDVSAHEKGAYTGELSAKSIADMGASFTLVGHSERRQYFKESAQEQVGKIQQALGASLKAIYCIGETLEQREAGETLNVVETQLKEVLGQFSADQMEDILIAYEPVWAIGTGKTATPAQAEEVHAHIRKHMTELLKLDGEKLVILYGGSVKPANVKELLDCPNIDGGLVGGASLKPNDYQELCRVASEFTPEG